MDCRALPFMGEMEGYTFRIDIHHSPWELKRANVTIQSNTLASFMKGKLQGMQPRAHYAKNKTARVFLQQLSIK